jgi:hypothetical protein
LVGAAGVAAGPMRRELGGLDGVGSGQRGVSDAASIHSDLRSAEISFEEKMKMAHGLRFILVSILIAAAPAVPSPARACGQDLAHSSGLQTRQPAFGQDLATFDGAKPTGQWNWRLTNDPVMGGLSTSTWAILGNVAIWNGTVAIVPSLNAPGFCTAATWDGFGVTARFPPVSGFTHMLLRVRSRTPSYSGFKVSFAADTLNPQFKSFKANFALKPTVDWQVVAIPFRPAFSNDWSPFDGECGNVDPSGRAHKCCTAETPDVCVTEHNLRFISQVGLWAEGKAGSFHLEIERIGAGNLAL